jgi:hypothetical protein
MTKKTAIVRSLGIVLTMGLMVAAFQNCGGLSSGNLAAGAGQGSNGSSGADGPEPEENPVPPVFAVPRGKYAKIPFEKTLPDPKVWGVYVTGLNLYLGTYGGLLTSADGGVTFTRQSFAPESAPNTPVAAGAVVLDGLNMYVPTQIGLMVSRNGGRNFFVSPNLAPANDIQVFNVVVSGDSIYASTTMGLAISRDRGATFKAKSAADGLAPGASTFVAVNGNSVYVVQNSRLSVSRDGGESFADSGLPANDGYRHVAFSGARIYVSSDLAVFVSEDNGEEFIPTLQNAGVLKTVVSGSSVYALGRRALYRSAVGGIFAELPGLPPLDVANQYTDFFVLGKYAYIATLNGLFIVGL